LICGGCLIHTHDKYTEGSVVTAQNLAKCIAILYFKDYQKFQHKISRSTVLMLQPTNIATVESGGC